MWDQKTFFYLRNYICEGGASFGGKHFLHEINRASGKII